MAEPSNNGPRHDLNERAKQALLGVQGYFSRTQHEDGYWWGELESNPTMEAEHLMLLFFLGADEGDRVRLVANDVRRRQREDGSWGMFYGAVGDLSTSVECYLALKFAGDTADMPHMVQARAFILSKGGVPRARNFTKIWLALFGQWPWEGTPIMPPELILLPTWAPFNIYRWSSWARATVVPLTVVLSERPVKKIDVALGIDELYQPGEKARFSVPRRSDSWLNLESIFWLADKGLRLYERFPWKPLRRHALKRIEGWVVDHQEVDGSWGGIQPPWVYSLIALNLLGHRLDNPVMAKGLDGFRGVWSLQSEDGEAMRVQACLSPVWDTCLATLGLLDSGLDPADPVLQRASSWMLNREVRAKGDWAVAAPKVEPSGFPFEFANESYPDIDDSSIVVMGLAAARFSDPERDDSRKAVITRALRWIEAMQSSNGGWASFDKNNDSKLVAKLPFSDFGEVLDPPSADVTAHILEMYGRLGYTVEHEPVRRGLEYVKRVQEADGGWFGRWGVNYIYGTGAVLPALEAVGEDMGQPYVRKAVQWLVEHQNADGGWGETCASYVDPALRGQGESTASQTSWALVALMASGEADRPATERGIAFLVDNQRDDGTWDEPQFTGCGFPGYGIGDQPEHPREPGDPHWQGEEMGAGFMINYHLYRDYFPLWALGRYLRARNGESHLPVLSKVYAQRD